MEHTTAKKPEAFKSESSIFVHENQYPRQDQPKLPTWSIVVVLVVVFFILKSFIYISDKKRKGK